MELNEFFKEQKKAALGFSGGVDSAYLLYAGLKAGADIKPYFIKTAFQPEFELNDALKLTAQLGVELNVITYDVLSDDQVARNTPQRCYYCKRALFGKLRENALQDGCLLLLDGTNASDDASDRPGMRALKELEVRSPLRECGLTKAEIRLLSREAGLFTWNKPAYACLATRVPCGRRLDKELLHNIEMAEDALFKLGFSDFRVRALGDAAKLQIKEEQLAMAFDKRKCILEAVKPFFSGVLLDMEER